MKTLVDLKVKSAVAALLAVLLLAGCGGGGEGPDPNPNPNPSPSPNPGPSAESTVEIPSLRGQIDRSALHVEVADGIMVIHDGINSWMGRLGAQGDVYEFKSSHRGQTALCSTSSNVGSTISFQCTLDGNACEYSLGVQEDGTYRETSNSCVAFMRSATTSKGLISKNVQGSAVAKEASESPALCEKIVSSEGETYSYSTSGSTSETEITANSGAETDGVNTLHVNYVRSASEKEGCFFWVCNGPTGNFHILMIPYNTEYIDPLRIEAFNRIRLAEAGGTTVNMMDAGDQIVLFPSFMPGPHQDISRAPVSYHKFLRGAYLSDNGQCEWYDKDVVGAQKVVYDNKVVWDWDDFCACGECADKLLFAVWESDEGYLDDAITYGEIPLYETVGGPLVFKNEEFEISFETRNVDSSLLESQVREPTDAFYGCVASPPGSSQGSVSGSLAAQDGQVYTPGEVKQVLFYTDKVQDPGEMVVFILFDEAIIDCRSELSLVNIASQEAIMLYIDLTSGKIGSTYGDFGLNLLGNSLQLFVNGTDNGIDDFGNEWTAVIDALFLPEAANFSFGTFTPILAGSFNAGFQDLMASFAVGYRVPAGGTLTGSFYSENYCGADVLKF